MDPHRRDVPVHDVLRAARAFHDGEGPTPDEALADRWPPKVVLARMEQLVAEGLLDYGVSLRTAWPTAEGRRALRSKQWGMIAEAVRIAAANNRDVTRIRIGAGVYADWRHEMERRATDADTFEAARPEQRIVGVPFVLDEHLPAQSIEFEGV